MRSLKSNSVLIDSLINNNRGLSIIILLKAIFYLSFIETFYYNIILIYLKQFTAKIKATILINIPSFVWYKMKSTAMTRWATLHSIRVVFVWIFK